MRSILWDFPHKCLQTLCLLPTVHLAEFLSVKEKGFYLNTLPKHEVWRINLIAENALKDKRLYDSIVEHRRIFVGLKGFDYNTLAVKTIKIVPPESIITQWQEDYELLQHTMIYGESLSFNKLIDRIKQLADLRSFVFASEVSASLSAKDLFKPEVCSDDVIEFSA